MARPLVLDAWFLTGPTASGKSAVSVELAARLGAEIVSMDSMALYRGMDIGTAKPPSHVRRSVPHHLIDVLEPHQEYSLAQYLAAAERCVEEVRSRGREVLFVGGTPLYLKGLLRGIFQGPPADWALRRAWEEEARCSPPGTLHRRLLEVDPLAAQRLHPNDTRRIIRALEVFAKTGQPISALQRQFEVGRPAERCRVFVLDWPKLELYARIDSRVDEMFAAGLLNEVRRLTRRVGSAHQNPQKDVGGQSPPCGLSRTARQALGYREVLEHLAGHRTLAETIALVKTHTRQFAKRQCTWFRSLTECRLVPVSGTPGPAEIAERIAALGRSAVSVDP